MGLFLAPPAAHPGAHLQLLGPGHHPVGGYWYCHGTVMVLGWYCKRLAAYCGLIFVRCMSWATVSVNRRIAAKGPSRLAAARTCFAQQLAGGPLH